MTVRAPRPVVRGVHGVVACGHPLGVGAGLHVMRQGGGAVDAAVAAAAALAVVMPEACGLGGDAFLTVRAADGPPVSFNGSGAAPAALAGPIPDDGAATAAVPGAVAAWVDALEVFGRVDRELVLAPAVALAAEGFPAGERLLAALASQRERLARGAAGWVLTADTLVPGTVVRQPALAATLEAIARDGTVALHRGALAEAVAQRVRADGGHLSVDDLAAHRTDVAEPLTARHADATLLLQPPVSQAVLAGLVLRVLDASASAPGPARSHIAVEAVEAAFAFRDRLVDRREATELLRAPPLLVDEQRARRIGGPRGYTHTTAVTAADASGTVVSMLVSVFDDFGSAALVPEGGFVLNDRLVGFAADPASPNAPAGGRRPIHTLSPAMLDDGDRVLALATPGADGQVQTLTQVVDGLAVEGKGLAEVVERPRWRSQEGRLLVEASMAADAVDAFAARGHEIVVLPDGDSLFGAVAVAGVDRRTGTTLAFADPRRETWAGGW